jgi:hypothetical protein
MAVGLIAAVLTSLKERRADLVDEVVILAGVRDTVPHRNILQRWGRAIYKWANCRWSKNLVHIPMAGNKMSARALLEWRKKAGNKPSLVFPEGIARRYFSDVRENSGTWLSTMPSPTIPVAVWYEQGAWHVYFGKPISWDADRALHDLQLALHIARLLPTELLSTQWQEFLRRSDALPRCYAARSADHLELT